MTNGMKMRAGRHRRRRILTALTAGVTFIFAIPLHFILIPHDLDPCTHNGVSGPHAAHEHHEDSDDHHPSDHHPPGCPAVTLIAGGLLFSPQPVALTTPAPDETHTCPREWRGASRQSIPLLLIAPSNSPPLFKG